MHDRTRNWNEAPLRATALATAVHASAGADVSITVEEPGVRFSLRLRASGGGGTLGSPASLLLTMPINSCVVAADRTLARLGPDEWQVSCREDSAEQTATEFTHALRSASFSLTDISHRNVALGVCGERAREVLNGGCPLDLHDAKFPPGSATRTVFGKAEIVLMRPGTGLSYKIECWRSFAPYVHALLRHGAREFGGP